MGEDLFPFYLSTGFASRMQQSTSLGWDCKRGIAFFNGKNSLLCSHLLHLIVIALKTIFEKF
jgi:hypothetical protein